jgi:outer membrane protein OmpA-like peptidoglycan-associated protein
MKSIQFCTILSIAMLVSGIGAASAQTVGYSDAIGQMGQACGPDIAKFCKVTQLGDGRMQQCLARSDASQQCKSAMVALDSLIKKRAAARSAVPKICDADIRQYCAGMQIGDGNLMTCFDQAKRRMSARCRQAVLDAGYETALAPNQSTSQVALDPNKIVQNLQGGGATEIDVPRLRQMVAASLADPSRSERVNREPLIDQLNNLAQFTIAIEFDFNSARIRPDSFRAVGLMADSLYSPYLQGYRFLIIGHTDGKGSREYNLKLSQQRADAIRAALINPFGISPKRLESIGFGEEQLLDRAHPEAAENRRVQLINIGKP